MALDVEEAARLGALMRKAYELADDLAGHEVHEAFAVLLAAQIIAIHRGDKNWQDATVLSATPPMQAVVRIGVALETNEALPAGERWGNPRAVR